MTTIDEAAADLALAKREEADARAARIAAEETLLAMLEAREEGTVSAKGEAWKVSVRYAMNRSVDAAALSAIRDQVPPALLEQAVEYAPKLKLPGLRYLRNNEPETYRVLAQAITAKPAKPAVSIEPIEARAAA